MNKFSGLIILLTFTVLCGCNLFENEEDHEFQIDEKTAQIVTADNKFGFELFQKVTTAETEADNIMISPLSVSLALAMTYNGAEGSTKTAMEETLKKAGLSRDEINKSYQSLVANLKSLDEKVLLEIANAIYYRDGFEVVDNFVTTNEEFYNAEISSLNFASPGALDVINGWVAEKTHDKITEILDEISPGHIMFLLNAIYFKGIWAKEFNPENTDQYPFFLEDGNSKNVDMMSRKDTLDYSSNDLFKAIRLPYGSGNFNMYAFLPQDGKSVQNIISQLDMDNWETWMNDFQETEGVEIKLPRFKFEYEIKLNDILTDMGMGVAFTGGANFTGINPNGGLRIDFVKHKTFVEVNEEGTEAAAVTVVGVELTSINPNEVTFIANRPFLFAITEKDTGAILFIGKVSNPEYSQ